MGKPRDIGVVEDTGNLLTLAKELILSHNKGDSKLILAVRGINMIIERFKKLPEICECKDACREEFEAKLPMKVRDILS